MNILGGKNQEQTINLLIAAVDKVLSAAGFSQSSRGEWVRRSHWKTEEIDLRVREMHDQELQPAFRVAIPRSEISPIGDTHRYIAERKLPQIVDPSVPAGTHISIPSFGFQIDRFVKTVVDDIQQSLVWFQQFETPELCKKHLDRFIKPGCPAFLDAEKVLNSLKK